MMTAASVFRVDSGSDRITISFTGPSPPLALSLRLRSVHLCASRSGTPSVAYCGSLLPVCLWVNQHAARTAIGTLTIGGRDW